MACIIFRPKEEIKIDTAQLVEGSIFDLLRKIPASQHQEYDINLFSQALDGFFGDDIKKEVNELYLNILDMRKRSISVKAFSCMSQRY